MNFPLRSLCFFLCIFFNSALQAQTLSQITGKVTGLVIDSLSRQPVQFATVTLTSTVTGKPVDGTLTNAQGFFSFSQVRRGSYSLTTSFLGYESSTQPTFIVSATRKEIAFNKILLNVSATKLQEVTIVAEKPLIEDKGDRLVYNAENDISNLGTTASDVLRKVPSVTVDADGNVQLRGSSNMRVLMNGKPSSILATNLAEALKQIPADIIKSVEVITSPSAKYDAEGTGGIINIITKKNNLAGVNGKVSVSGGNRGRYGTGSLNARRGKFGINSNLSLYGNNNRSSIELVRESAEGVAVNNLYQNGSSRNLNNGFYGQIEFDFDPDTLNAFTLSLSYNKNNYLGTRQQNSLFVTPEERQQQYYDLRNIWGSNGLDANFGYTHTFKTKQELAVLAQVNRRESFDIYDNLQLNADRALIMRQLNDNDAPSQEKTLQVDYTQTFGNESVLEVGLKSIRRDSQSDAHYNFLFPNRQDSLLINNFAYDQDVYAAYFTYAIQLKKKYNVALGSRYEFTHTQGKFENIAANELTRSMFKNDYDNLIPSISVARSFKEIHTVRASYTQRIQRPQIWLLNPYEMVEDFNNIYQGNPELDAELTHSYELGYSTYFKTNSLNASLFLRQTDNAIQELATQEKRTIKGEEVDVLLTTNANIARNVAYGFSLSGVTKPMPAWSVSPSLNLNYVNLKSPSFSNSGWQYNFTLNSSYEFKKGISAQFYGGYNSPKHSLQGEQRGYSYTSISVRKKFFKEKGAISVGVNNPFNKTIRNGSTITTDTFSQNSTYYNPARHWRISLDFNFGKMTSTQRQKKAIQNDDAIGGK